jgi:hypothetical protein
MLSPVVMIVMTLALKPNSPRAEIPTSVNLIKAETGDEFSVRQLILLRN